MPVRVIAHRGASGTRPENTLASFREAVALGADMIELDVQLCRDGEVVVLHDDTLDRTTNGGGFVRDHTLADLRRLDAGAWFGAPYAGERVPTLEEVLRAVRLPINVELKQGGGTGLEEVTLARVQEAGALDRIVFSSFDPAILVRLRALTADAALAVLWTSRRLAPALELARRVGARALHLRKSAASREGIAAARESGLEVRLWTVNEPRQFAHLEAWGAHAVFTDYPDRFLQIR